MPVRRIESGLTSTTTRTGNEKIDWLPVLLYGDLFRYSDLFLNLFRRELRVKYRGSLLGLGWTLINPIVLMFGYWLLFSILLRAVSIEHYPLFVISGIVPWIFFQSAVQMSASSLLGQSNLVKQVRFPRQLLPLSVVATNLVTAGVMLAVVIPVNLLIAPETRSTFWLTFPMLVPLIALTCGLAIVVAAATVIFRDVEHLLTAIFLPWFVLTPIFYTFDQLPGIEGNELAADALYYGNFMAPIVEAIRDPLFFGDVPALSDVVYSTVAALLALAAGALVFRRLDDRLAAEL
jgi:ABC-type polysaccharide/polyol phosphate export permease